MIKVIGIGQPIMDFLIHTKRLPKSNESCALKDYSWQGGGKVPSALVALGRLGVKTGMIGLVGNDVYGQFCIDDFKRHDVDVTYLHIDDADNPFCICISESDTQERSFIGKGSSIRSLELDDLNEEYITQADYLHLSHIDSIIKEAISWARQAGMKIVFDGDQYHKDTEKNYNLIDVFIASEFYYKDVFQDKNYEENCRAIQKEGPEIVIFTLGEKGCVGVYDNKYFEIPAFKIDVMDTTGAGDVFHGAFIYGMLQDWNVEKIAEFASAVSAIKCTRVGGRAAIPNLETVQRFLLDGYIDYEEIDNRVEFYRKRIFDI